MKKINKTIGGNMGTVKTTKRNYLFVIQKKVGKNWERITDVVFTKRHHARECSNELTNVARVTGRGPNRRYRVAIMRVSQPQTIADTTVCAVAT